MFLIAALLMSAQPAADAQSAAPPPVPAPAAEPKKKEKKVCKSDDQASGSRMAKRLCLTEEEWAERDRGMTNSARSGFSGKTEDH